MFLAAHGNPHFLVKLNQICVFQVFHHSSHHPRVITLQHSLKVATNQSPADPLPHRGTTLHHSRVVHTLLRVVHTLPIDRPIPLWVRVEGQEGVQVVQPNTVVVYAQDEVDQVNDYMIANIVACLLCC